MEIVVRATVIYWFLWLVIRGSGKRELSEMSPFEMILLVVMGDLVQQGVTQEDFSLTGAVLAVGTFTLWVIGSSYLSFRFKRVAKVLDGIPAVIVRDGVPLENVLSMQRVTLDDVREEARSQGISDLRDVQLAILEPDGTFSFLLKRDERGATDGGDGPSHQHHAVATEGHDTVT